MRMHTAGALLALIPLLAFPGARAEEPAVHPSAVDLFSEADAEGEDVCVGTEEQCTPDTLFALAAAPSPMGPVRIGVVPAATSVAVGGTGAFEVRNGTTGALLLSGRAESATVTLGSVLVSTTSRRLQVTCTPSASDRDARLAAGQSQGYGVYSEFVPGSNCWRVYVGERPLPVNTALEAALKAELVSRGHATAAAFWRTVTITQGETRYRVVKGGLEALSPNSVRVVPLDGLVTIAGRKYRGEAEVRLNGSGTLAGINELPLEEYLYGVVPRELGPVAFPELEALKAQAVAARTYTLSNRGKRSADGYDLTNTTSDQVYGGFQDEHPLATQAVDETAGVVAMYGGDFIDALYFSTSGGFTASNEEAFSSQPVAYLRGVPDHQRGRALEHVPSLEVFRNHANPRSLRAMRQGDFESDWAGLHRWSFSWSAEEMRQVVSAFAKQDVGRVLAIHVTERGPSGRALRIEYVTEAGTFSDTKDRIRASLRFVNADGQLQNLPSTLFFVEPVLDRHTGEVTGFEAHGGGFGHGVGLCQTGAVGMAEKKASYEDILRHYYRWVDLVRM